MQDLSSVLFVLKEIYDRHTPFQIALDKAFDRYKLTDKDRSVCRRITADYLRHSFLTEIEIGRAFPRFDHSDEQTRLLGLGLLRLRRADEDQDKKSKEITLLMKTSELLHLSLTEDDMKSLETLSLTQPTVPADLAKDPVTNNSLVFNCPAWVINAYIAEYGTETALEILQASVKEPQLWMTVNTLKKSASDFASDERFKAVTSINPDYPRGGTLLALKGNRASLYPEVLSGEMFPQDLAWFNFLDILHMPQYGKVLHVSAKRGILSAALALRAHAVQAQVKAVYTDSDNLVKAKALHRRLGLDNVEDISSSILMLKTILDFDSQDLVVVTPSCSHLGQTTRRPDAAIIFDADTLSLELQKSEATLIEASFFTAKDGCLAYAVPSLLKEEGERIVSLFLSKRPQFKLLAEKELISSAKDELRSDGFYYAVMVRED